MERRNPMRPTADSTACGRGRLLQTLSTSLVWLISSAVHAAGTPAGTIIDTTALVEYDVNGSRVSTSSNTASVTVDERLDVAVTLQSSQVAAAAGETNRTLVFTVTNTGNGSEGFELAVDSALAGDDYDPLPASPAIWFDSDSSGDLSVADVAYAPGSNEPVLAADESLAILVVNDIPPTAGDGGIGLSELRATSLTGSGAPGTIFAGDGDNGVTAITGSSGGTAAVAGEYIDSGALVSVSKSVDVTDPFGGSAPVPGATLTYTVEVQVTGSAVAANSVFNDPVPANTSFVASSLALNGVPLTDAADSDAGELVSSAAPVVTVRLGDLSQGDGVQTVSFQVTID